MKKDWFKYRGYPHIPDEVPINRKPEIKRYLVNRSNVAKHSFLPFISKKLIERRYKKLNINNNLRAHWQFDEGQQKVSTKKIRTIMYCCHQDAQLYSYYSKLKIEPKYEKILQSHYELNKSIIAYRSIPTEIANVNKNNIYFAKEVFDLIKQKGPCAAIAFDIKNFFPSLDHKILKKAWAKVIGCKSLPKDHYNIYKSVTNYSFININDIKTSDKRFNEKELAYIQNAGKNSYFQSVKDFLESEIQIYKNSTKGKGIPQGLPISAILANIYLLEFDKTIVHELCTQQGVSYRRYSDDMIFICEMQQIDEVKRFIQAQISKYKLKIAPEKTETVIFDYKSLAKTKRLESTKVIAGKRHPNTPLTYLGFEFYGYQTLIKSKNLAAFYREMKESVQTKHKRVERIKRKHLIDQAPIFKRKIYRLYTYKGTKSRTKFLRGKTEKYRGNFIKYAMNSAEILEAPEIRKQIRNHWKILKKTIEKYEFSNPPNSTPTTNND